MIGSFLDESFDMKQSGIFAVSIEFLRAITEMPWEPTSYLTAAADRRRIGSSVPKF